MKRYSLLLLVSLLAAGDSMAAVRSTQDKPDILFILIDDLRWDALSYKGHPYVQTPNIDKLRDQGADMANAFVTTSMCCPSRATFLTGTYASQHGVIDNETSEYNPEITPPVTKYLQEAGYTTAMIGKWHMAHHANPRPFFDHWASFEGQGKYTDVEMNINETMVQWKGYTTDRLTDEAIGFIERQPKDNPYFCMLSHKAVHGPFQPAPRHADAFGAKTKDLLPSSWDDTFESKPEWQRREQQRAWRWDWRTRDIENEAVKESIPPIPFNKKSKYVNQLRCLAAVDEGVGRILEVLKKRGSLKNTLIVFASDNGYFHGEHRRWDKRVAYDESLRIPMVMSYPGHIEAGSTVTQMVSNLDFAPTLLGFAGAPIPEQMQGLDMRPLLEGGTDPSSPNGSAATGWRDNIFYEYWVDLTHSVPTMVAARTDRYKLVQYPDINDIDELYDLERDPHEMSNLAQNPEFAQVHAEMKALLQKSIQEAGWRPDVFPQNLPRFKGPKGVLKEVIKGDAVSFQTPADIMTLPFDEATDPSSWPYLIDLEVSPTSDGVIVSQAGKKTGFKLFVQDGRPGVATACQTTWKHAFTTIDGPESVHGQWTRLQVAIDYNRLTFAINGEVVDSRALPQPFKFPTKAPLLVGTGSPNPVVEGTPNNPFKGQIRELVIRRDMLK